MSDASDYALGYSDHEERRLTDQAAQLEVLTENLLRRAGLKPGMRVLDVGCGMGDVSLLAARLVGESGAVLGVDKAATSIDIAERRAAEAGARNVSFEAADVAAFETHQQFDALIGRLVLLYVPDRVAVLKRLARHLNRGAIVAFQELDMSLIAQTPPSALFTQTRRWLLEAMVAGGAELDMGMKLYATFREAGWPAPDLFSMTPIVYGPTPAGYQGFAQILRSLLPVIERNGIATPGEMDLDTLGERLRSDAVENDRIIFMSRIVGAWTRLP